MAETITRKAYAKINLGLDVVGIREDGYHEVRMVMQSIGLFDRITVSARTDGRLTMEIASVAEGALPDGAVLSTEDNLCIKAVDKLRREAGITDGIHIVLEKNIPVAAGLAGGSTDAAAVLAAANELWGLSYTNEELRKIAVTIGADVPYCLFGGTALSEGIGEVLTALPAFPECDVLIARPNAAVSTAGIYTEYDALEDPKHPDIDALISGIKEGNLNTILQNIDNTLEDVTVPKLPVINDIKRMMTDNGADVSCMTGSGPTVFGLFFSENKSKVNNCANALSKSGACSFVKSCGIGQDL